jgi:hypothetical protein
MSPHRSIAAIMARNRIECQALTLPLDKNRTIV